MGKAKKMEKLITKYENEIKRLYDLLEKLDWDQDLKNEIETKIDVLEEVVNDLVRVA